MKVTVNGAVYEDITWQGNGFSFETEKTLAQIEKLFKPGEDATIIVADGEIETARYYNKALNSMTVNGTDPRTVTVLFDLTQITENAETVIRNDMESSDEAIAELGELVAELCDADLDGMKGDIQSHQETINTWFSQTNEIFDFMNKLKTENGILDQFEARMKDLNIRVSALEADAGIVKIEENK